MSVPLLILCMILSGCASTPRIVTPILRSGNVGIGSPIATHLQRGCQILYVEKSEYHPQMDRYYFSHSRKCGGKL